PAALTAFQPKAIDRPPDGSIDASLVNVMDDLARAFRQLQALRDSIQRTTTGEGGRRPNGTVAVSTEATSTARRAFPGRPPIAIEPFSQTDLVPAMRLLERCVAELRMSPLVLRDFAERHDRPIEIMLKASRSDLTDRPLIAIVHATFRSALTFVERLA